jgi:hypothetical protein
MRAVTLAVVSITLLATWPAAAVAGDSAVEPRAMSSTGSWALVPAAPAFGEPSAAPLVPPTSGSTWALPSILVEDGLLADRGMERKPKDPKPKTEEGEKPARPRAMRRLPQALSGERARLMLRSLTVPGWGQATLGERRAAIAFGLLEAGIWGSFTAFRIQQQMRQQTYERTARLFAGVELSGRDEEYRRIVGFYLSSEEYNRLVVRRDAASLYFGDPTAYDAYIAEHELKGDDAWAWDSEGSLLRYRAERQATQRAIKHAHDALAAAVINRLLSVIHASAKGAHRDAAQTSWRVECVPNGGDPTAFRLGLRADF